MNIRDWVETWDRAGVELDKLRKKRLAEYDHKKNIPQIEALLELGVRFARSRPTSGFVEQQRIFAKLRQ